MTDLAIRTDTTIPIPDATREMLSRFERRLESVRHAPTTSHASARIKFLYQTGAQLSNHSDELVGMLERGERWLNANKDHPDHGDREDQWIAWLHEYEAIQDALIAAKGVI